MAAKVKGLGTTFRPFSVELGHHVHAWEDDHRKDDVAVCSAHEDIAEAIVDDGGGMQLSSETPPP